MNSSHFKGISLHQKKKILKCYQEILQQRQVMKNLFSETPSWAPTLWVIVEIVSRENNEKKSRKFIDIFEIVSDMLEALDYKNGYNRITPIILLFN